MLWLFLIVTALCGVAYGMHMRDRSEEDAEQVEYDPDLHLFSIVPHKTKGEFDDIE